MKKLLFLVTVLFVSLALISCGNLFDFPNDQNNKDQPGKINVNLNR